MATCVKRILLKNKNFQFTILFMKTKTCSYLHLFQQSDSLKSAKSDKNFDLREKKIKQFIFLDCYLHGTKLIFFCI